MTRTLTTKEQGFLSLCQCEKCPLQAVRNPVMGSGNTAAGGLVVVGEAPGRNEAQEGYPFRGQAGKLLDATLAEAGLSRDQVYTTNAVLCRPTEAGAGKKDTAPPAGALAACRPRLEAEIRAVSPNLVVTVGASAVHAMLPNLGETKITALIGSSHWDKTLNTWIIPTYHPAAVLHGKTEYFDDILSTFRRVAGMLSWDRPYPTRLEDLTIEYEHITDFRRAATAMFQLTVDGGPLAIDVETDNKRFLEDALLLVSISSHAHNYVFNAPVLAAVQTLFVAMLEDPAYVWVLHNMSYDFNFLRYHYGAVPTNAIDTMCLALGISERSGAIGLKRLAWEYLGAPHYEKEVQEYFNRRHKMSDVPIETLVRYAAYDTYYTLGLLPVLQSLVAKEQSEKLVYDILIPAQRLFAEMEYTGVLVDVAQAVQVEKAWQPYIEGAERDLIDHARSVGFDPATVVKVSKSAELNPRSFPQLASLFFDVMDFTPVEGRRSTGKDFLKANAGEPVIVALQTLRAFDKALRTYIGGARKSLWLDGRVHPQFHIAAAKTGRISITDPAMQQIPHYGVERKGITDTDNMAREIRRMYIATPGYQIVDADYKQLELRVAWHVSGDENLGLALMSGDFHAFTASRVFHIPIEQVTKTQRFICKHVSFGVMYGRQAKSLAENELNCSIREAQAYINAFWAAYPKYQAWWEQIRLDVQANEYVQSQFGRKRRWSLFTPDNLMDILNEAVNMPIQSFASDMCLTAAIRLNALIKAAGYGRMLFLVHDSIVCEILNEHVENARTLIHDTMIVPPFPTCATFDVDVSVGPTWADVA